MIPLCVQGEVTRSSTLPFPVNLVIAAAVIGAVRVALPLVGLELGARIGPGIGTMKRPRVRWSCVSTKWPSTGRMFASRQDGLVTPLTRKRAYRGAR